MRVLKSTFLSLATLLVLCSPALAQSTPTYSQYGAVVPGGSGIGCPPDAEECSLQSIDDGVQGMADNAGQGTAAVNDALADPASSAEASTAPPASTPVAASVPGATIFSESGDTTGSRKVGENKAGEDENKGAGRNGGLASITALPETGGPSLAALGSGLLLVTLGLLIRKAADR